MDDRIGSAIVDDLRGRMAIRRIERLGTGLGTVSDWHVNLTSWSRR